MTARKRFIVLVAESHRPTACALQELLEDHGGSDVCVYVALDGHHALALIELVRPHISLLSGNLESVPAGIVAVMLRRFDMAPRSVSYMALTLRAFSQAAASGLYDSVFTTPIDISALVDHVNAMRILWSQRRS